MLPETTASISDGRRREPLFLIILALLISYFGIAIAYVFVVRDWQPYDEPWHFTYIDKLAREGRIPTVDESTECHQPPLYYALLSPAVKKHTPYKGICHYLRLVSLVFGALAVLVFFQAFRELFKSSTHAALMAFMVMNIPMVMGCFASITNDSAAILFSAVVFLIIIRLRGCDNPVLHLLLGVVAGLALLSKGTCLFLCPVVALFYLQEKSPLKVRARNAALCLIATVAIAGWFYIRNTLLYGDPTGSGEVLKLFEKNTRNMLSPGEFIRWNALFFDQFWNVENFLRNKVPLYPFSIRIIQLAVTLIPLAGGALALLRRGQRKSFTSNGLLFGASALILWAVIYSNSFRVYMPTGRFMFPALIPLCYLWYVGSRHLFRGRTMGVFLAVNCILMLCINIYLLAVVFPPLPPMPFDAPF